MSRPPPQIEAGTWIPPVEDPKDKFLLELLNAAALLVSAVEDAKSAAAGKVASQLAGEAVRQMRVIGARQLRLTGVVMTVFAIAAAAVVSGVMWWMLRPAPLSACIEQPSHWVPVSPAPTRGLKS